MPETFLPTLNTTTLTCFRDQSHLSFSPGLPEATCGTEHAPGPVTKVLAAMGTGLPVGLTALPASHTRTQTHTGIGNFSSVQFSRLLVSDSMDCSTPGFPVRHQLPELTQTHVHRVGDAIQSSHLLLSPSPPALNLSQHQDLFK